MLVSGRRTPRWFGKAGDNSTIWDSPSPKFIMGGSKEEKCDHPTQKPIELMRRPILNHAKRGAVVYDPFLGSGTTLIAAELTGRVCYGMELDPKYVDVIVQRWQGFTSKQATLEADGRTFDEVKAERLGVAAWIARCRKEIADIESQIRAGHPDIEGLCRALADWGAELRLLAKEGWALARPEAKIDLAELEKLCGMQCTDQEIAAFFGVSTRTIERRRKVKRFSDVMENAKATRCTLLG
jgi:hypothetical protein